MRELQVNKMKLFVDVECDTLLLELPYYDIVRCHVIDPMHNLLLGTAKHEDLDIQRHTDTQRPESH